MRGHYTAPAGAPRIEAKAVLDEMLAKRSQGRKQPGSWIGDAIYGVNDGLGAIFGIVSGVSGATSGDAKYVLLAGLSGGMAGELGHITVVPNGNPCACGNRGCLEKHASATAIVAMAHMLHLGENLTSKDIADLAAQPGDERATRLAPSGRRWGARWGLRWPPW